MRIVLFGLSLLLTFSVAQATEYGRYESKRILLVSQTPAGKTYGLDVKYLDQMMGNLSIHAKNYPPQFDNNQDKQRAIQDVKALSGMLDILMKGPSANPALLWRVGLLNSMGHNLDIPGSAEKASAVFQQLLAMSPSDPRGNYMYGTFLAGVGKLKEALPYLEKALFFGVTDATYTLGMTHLSLGHKEKALENLNAYRQRNPNDPNVVALVDAIRNGRIELKNQPN